MRGSECVFVCIKSTKSPISDGDCEDLDDIPSQARTKIQQREESECVLWTHDHTYTWDHMHAHTTKQPG